MIFLLQDFLRHFYCLSKAYDPVFVIPLFMHSYFIRLCICNLNFIITVKRTISMNRSKNRLWISLYLGACVLGNRLQALSILCIMGISVFYSGNGGLVCPVNQLSWNRSTELMHTCYNF